jgi:undecaprenyl-phosphate galactose phosphotransferase
MNEQTLVSPGILRANIKHIPTKRIFDVLFSLLIITFLSPIYLLIAFIIRLTSKGNIIFVQERIGRGGYSFKCFKFRTMYPDAETRLHTLLDKHPNLKLEWTYHHKLKNDPRITPVGAFLRKTSLDELPQFWNVLKGDLSVVGPRPAVHEEIVKHYGMKAAKILSIRPGITGIWQVSGRNDVPYPTRIKMDEKYVDHHSISLDIKLIFKTIPKMINTKGAY